MDQKVAEYVSKGWAVESRSESQAVVSKKGPHRLVLERRPVSSYGRYLVARGAVQGDQP